MINLRNADIKDIEFILESFRKIKIASGGQAVTNATAEKLEKDLFTKNPKAWALIAEKNAKAVGLSLYSTVYYADEGELMWVSEFYVDEQHRGQGIFSKMLAKLEDISKEPRFNHYYKKIK